MKLVTILWVSLVWLLLSSSSSSPTVSAFGVKPQSNVAMTSRVQQNPHSAVLVTPLPTPQQVIDTLLSNVPNTASLTSCTILIMAAILCLTAWTGPAFAVDADGRGASDAANAKITKGGASTLQSGRTISITRGVNLDRSDFSGQNLKGVAFQQSIVRDSNFKNSNLMGASFFDATLDGSDFEGADLSFANLEMAQLTRASLKVMESYIMVLNVQCIFMSIGLCLSLSISCCVLFHALLGDFTHFLGVLP